MRFSRGNWISNSLRIAEATAGAHCSSFSAPRSRLHFRATTFFDSHQIIYSTGDEGCHQGLRLPDEAGLAPRPPPEHLEPTEDFLDPFSLALADSVALGVVGPSKEFRRLATIDSSNGLTDSILAQMGHEHLHAVTIVGDAPR